MSRINKFGISDYISNKHFLDIKKKSNYACVVCANPFYTKEHLIPEFKSLTEKYDPQKHTVCLLCMSCQFARQNKLLSVEKVLRFLDNPKSKQLGNRSTMQQIDFGEKGFPWITLGTNRFKCSEILKCNDKVLLQIEPPEYPSQPFLLSASFYNDTGKLIMEITKNELVNYMGDWEISIVRNKFTFLNTTENRIYLELLIDPDTGINISRMYSEYDSVKLEVDSEGIFRIKDKSINLSGTTFETYGGIYIRDDQTGFGYGPTQEQQLQQKRLMKLEIEKLKDITTYIEHIILKLPDYNFNGLISLMMKTRSDIHNYILHRFLRLLMIRLYMEVDPIQFIKLNIDNIVRTIQE